MAVKIDVVPELSEGSESNPNKGWRLFKKSPS